MFHVGVFHVNGGEVGTIVVNSANTLNRNEMENGVEWQEFLRAEKCPIRGKKFSGPFSVRKMYAPVHPLNFFFFVPESQNNVLTAKIL